MFDTAQVRELDRIAIDELRIPGYTLMTRAGEAALACLQKHWPDWRRVLIYCGAGNNAGDGYVLARLVLSAGFEVEIVQLVPPEQHRGDAKRAWEALAGLRPRVVQPDESHTGNADVLIDAILGTGLTRPLDGGFAAAVEQINRSTRPVLALDIPSGLDGDSGRILGDAVVANVTMSFVGLKQGCFLGDGPALTGRLEFADLDIPSDAQRGLEPRMLRLGDELLKSVFAPRSRLTHKGDCGHVLVIGGGPGMPGAASLAGEAALRTGAGLVSVATHPDNVGTVVSTRRELMCHGTADGEGLEDLMSRADVIALGPGLGRDDWGREIYRRAIRSDTAMIVDADALNWLAEEPSPRGSWVLTPHPGEAGRLLGTDGAEVQANRLASVREIARRFDAVAVLKGSGTLIADTARPVALCDAGNPGMATAGMGDVLTGLIAGIAAQGSDLWSAARAGVLVHARAGDAAADAAGERGLLASDLYGYVRSWINPAR